MFHATCMMSTALACAEELLDRALGSMIEDVAPHHGRPSVIVPAHKVSNDALHASSYKDSIDRQGTPGKKWHPLLSEQQV